MILHKTYLCKLDICSEDESGSLGGDYPRILETPISDSSIALK